MPLPLGVWKGLPFVIVPLPGLFSNFFSNKVNILFRETFIKFKFKLLHNEIRVPAIVLIRFKCNHLRK